MNTARKGTKAELATADFLEADGWLVGSRRHIKGPGDLVAVKVADLDDWGAKLIRLVEVKATKNGPYAGFPPKDRKELLSVARANGAAAYLAWWAPGAREPILIPSEGWPR